MTAEPQASTPPTISDSCQASLDALHEALRDYGKPRKAKPFPKDPVVNARYWREAFARHEFNAGLDEQSITTAFKQSKNDLTKAKRIRIYREFAWAV